MFGLKSILLSDPEGHGNIEAVMDYIVAWTFKMCDRDKYYHGIVDMKLLTECRNIVSRLIGVDIYNRECSVETYLESEKIDLCVEIRFKDNGEYHALLFENKVNAKLPEHELNDNKTKFDKHYNNDEGCIKHYILLCAHEPKKYMIDQCKLRGFECFKLEDLTDYNAPDIGNPIFDEFWRRDWGE